MASDAALIERMLPRLLLYARTWCRRSADADDVVQEAAMRFMRDRSMQDPAAYLFSCVRGAALDWLRRESRLHRRHEAAAASSDPLFVDTVAVAERRTAVESALATLTAEQRETVVLRLWGDRSFPQIGVICGVPEETARSRYRGALATLKGLLVAHGVDDA